MVLLFRCICNLINHTSLMLLLLSLHCYLCLLHCLCVYRPPTTKIIIFCWNHYQLRAVSAESNSRSVPSLRTWCRRFSLHFSLKISKDIHTHAKAYKTEMNYSTYYLKVTYLSVASINIRVVRKTENKHERN